MNRLDQIKARFVEIRSLVEGGADHSTFEKEMEDLKAEQASIEARNKFLGGIPASAAPVPNPAAPAASAPAEDRFNTVEYRSAFMQFAKTGVMPADFSGQEYRANAATAVADAAAVIPTTILDEVLKKMYTVGQIFARVRKLNVKGGVQVPILSLKPVATWITEAATSDRQKATVNTNISFTYFGLECKVATSLLAETVTLASFESTLISLIVEAMAKAIDMAIIKGSGSGQPLGITVDTRVVAGQKITVTAADFLKWDAWQKQVFAKIPLSYRSGGSFIMASGTFDGYINGMVGTDGQPIGRVNYGITDGPQERFGGKEVILVEDDVIKPYDAAATGDIVAVFCKLSDYAINSNMQMQMYRWLDHDTNQWVDKAILIADGKMIDVDGVLIIKKGA